MKRTQLIALCLMAGVLSACAQKKSATAATPLGNKDTYSMTMQSQQMRSDKPAGDDANMSDDDGNMYPYYYEKREAKLKLPTALGGMTDEQVDAIKRKLLKEGFGSSSDNAATAWLDSSAPAFEGSSLKMVKGELPSPDAWMGLVTEGVGIYPVAACDGFVTFAVSRWEDRGTGMGAGTSSAEEYFTFARNQADFEADAFAPENIFTAGKPAKNILLLINRQLRLKKRTGEDCVSDEATRIPETMYISKKGMVFCFSKYEVACGAAGNYEVTVPWASIKPYLRPAAYTKIQKALLNYKGYEWPFPYE